VSIRYAQLLLCFGLAGSAAGRAPLIANDDWPTYGGGLAAWSGFTLPSAILMVLFAYGASALTGAGAVALLHGLRLVAVAIVAQAVWEMARRLSRGRARASITLVSALLLLMTHSTWAQLTAIASGAVLGRLFCSSASAGSRQLTLKVPVSKRAGAIALTAFLALLILPALVSPSVSWPGLELFNAFYRSGALVFGGGHVVLPLLREAFVTPGWVTDDTFLAGYGAAQAVPGPLFTFAAYLGAVVRPTPHGLPGAALGLLSIFLPGFLIVLGALPYWDSLRGSPAARAMMSGVNAAVVGILAAALYEPLWTTSVMSPADLAMVLVGFVLLTVWRLPALLVVVSLATAAVLLEVLGGIT